MTLASYDSMQFVDHIMTYLHISMQCTDFSPRSYCTIQVLYCTVGRDATQGYGHDMIMSLLDVLSCHDVLSKVTRHHMIKTVFLLSVLADGQPTQSVTSSEVHQLHSAV